MKKLLLMSLFLMLSSCKKKASCKPGEKIETQCQLERVRTDYQPRYCTNDGERACFKDVEVCRQVCVK